MAVLSVYRCMIPDLPVDITPKAIEEVQHILNKKQVPEGYSLRLGIRGGGCGAAFFLGFDQPKDFDLTYSLDGLSILLDKRHLLYLTGVQLDFVERETEKGFVFTRGTA